MEQKNNGFNSNFGFLMASIGSAVGLGNLWSFPYKMGNNGGFAFLICYLVFLVLVGYPMLMGEFAIAVEPARLPSRVSSTPTNHLRSSVLSRRSSLTSWSHSTAHSADIS